MAFKINKEIYPWQEVYQNADFEKLCKKIRLMLNNKKLLYAYYPIARILKRNNKEFKKSIELGAGTGQFSLILKKLGFIDEVYLVDVEKGALDIAKKLFNEFGEKCNIIHSDLFDLKKDKKTKKDKKFDLCFSGGLIEHFVGAEQREVVKIHLDLAEEVIFQFPYDSKTYWAMRNLITLREGKWPFGYEYPLSKKDIFRLIYEVNEGSNCRVGMDGMGVKCNSWAIKDEDYHYLQPIILSKIPFTLSKISNLFLSNPFINLNPMDYVVYCTKRKYKMLDTIKNIRKLS